MLAMRRPTLPPACRWAHSAQASYLYFHFGCIAVVEFRDGGWQVRVHRKRAHDVCGMAPSQAKGILYVERWLDARGWLVLGAGPVQARPTPRLPVPTLPLRPIESAPALLRPGDADLIYQQSSETLSND